MVATAAIETLLSPELVLSWTWLRPPGICLYTASAGGFRLRKRGPSLFTARFCELSIARVLGAQNGALCSGSGGWFAGGPPAFVVSSGRRLD